MGLTDANYLNKLFLYTQCNFLKHSAVMLNCPRYYGTGIWRNMGERIQFEYSVNLTRTRLTILKIMLYHWDSLFFFCYALRSFQKLKDCSGPVQKESLSRVKTLNSKAQMDLNELQSLKCVNICIHDIRTKLKLLGVGGVATLNFKCFHSQVFDVLPGCSKAP